MSRYTGIWPALITPLTTEGRVNVPVAEALINDLIAAGISGLYVCGGTGEGVLLAPAVRRAMAEVAIGAASGRVPVMVHIGAISTELAVSLAQHASLIGADALSAVPPFYYSVPFSAIVAHYRAITEAANVPLYVYYIPSATGNPLTPEQLLEICAMDGIAGFKYTSQDLFALTRILALRDPDQVNILSGPDELFLPCLALGVDGAVGTTYNFMPRLYIDIMGAYLAGDYATARRLQWVATTIITKLLPMGAIASAKALMPAFGYEVGFGVPPLPHIAGEDAQRLLAEVEGAGLFAMRERESLYGPAGDPMRGRLA